MIKKIYGKHTFLFTLLTVGLSIFALLSKDFFSSLNELVILFVCLFFILSIGISHGALDNYKANKLLKIYKVNNKAIFFLIYIIISALVIFIWSLYSTYTLLAFFNCCFLSFRTWRYFVFTRRKFTHRSIFLFN